MKIHDNTKKNLVPIIQPPRYFDDEEDGGHSNNSTITTTSNGPRNVIRKTRYLHVDKY